MRKLDDRELLENAGEIADACRKLQDVGASTTVCGLKVQRLTDGWVIGGRKIGGSLRRLRDRVANVLRTLRQQDAQKGPATPHWVRNRRLAQQVRPSKAAAIS